MARSSRATVENVRYEYSSSDESVSEIPSRNEKWDEGRTLKLIEEYKKHPILFDANHPHFKTQKQKKAAWLYLSKSVGGGGELDDVYRKIKSLKSIFANNLMKMGTGDEWSPTWIYFEKLIPGAFHEKKNKERIKPWRFLKKARSRKRQKKPFPRQEYNQRNTSPNFFPRSCFNSMNRPHRHFKKNGWMMYSTLKCNALSRNDLYFCD
ncbi:hypothetical protein JTE90_000255 [Oedothorax gibbosus]|uniref:MADF domain-containing protein n=1 Tax=Oedothorax gibbosus TaxID=931172 RepID=A0AAV6VTL0_9ARAC|nr:hypothetical protein JTE90_000255 [Oedothorax gibbosus]